MAKGRKTGGRQKGALNKTTATVKAAIEGAFDHLERTDKPFNKWAEENQTLFYTQLLPKIIPQQIKHSGDEDEPPVGVKIIREVVRAKNTDS